MSEEKNRKLKLILIVCLSLIIIFLVTIFFLAGRANKESANVPAVINEAGISKGIDSILFTFGISKQWIVEPVSKGKVPVKSGISKEVVIPNDILSIDLNYELTDFFRSRGIKNKVTEDPKSKNILMNFSSDTAKDFSGAIKFIFSDTVKRNAANVCLVFDSLDNYNIRNVQNLLASAQNFSVFTPVRNDKADIQSEIFESKRDYLIKFSVGGEEDVDADFKPDMNEKILKQKIRSVQLNFPGVTAIILVYKSNKKDLIDFGNELKKEFENDGKTVYEDTIFSSVKYTGSKVNSLFEDIPSKSAAEKKYLFYDINFNPEEFSEYDSQVYSMKKLGYKFLSFKELKNLMDKSQEKVN